MKMQCPFCSAALEIPDEYAGQEVTCAACNEKFIADAPEYAPPFQRQESALDHITPALFKQFVTIEDSIKAIQGKIAAQVWTCVGLLVGGVVMMALVGGFFRLDTVVGGLLMLVAGGVVLAGIIHIIASILYWAVYKIACWRTTAINSGIPAVYAVDPKQVPRKMDASFFD